MNLLDENKKKLSSGHKPSTGQTALNTAVLEQQLKKLSLPDHKSTLLSYAINFLRKTIIFMAFQSVFLLATLYLSVKVPVVGSLMKYALDGVTSTTSYFEVLELNEKLHETQARVNYLETLNEKLKESLIEIETEHPELFDKNSEPKRSFKWKYLWTAAAATAGVFIIKYFFLGSGNAAAAAAFSGTVALARQSEEVADARHNAVMSVLDSQTDIIHGVVLSMKGSYEIVHHIHNAIGVILERLSINYDVSEINNVIDNERKNFILEDKAMPCAQNLTFENVINEEPSDSPMKGLSVSGSDKQESDSDSTSSVEDDIQTA